MKVVFFKAQAQGMLLWFMFERIDGHDVVLLHSGSAGRQLLGERVTPTEVPESWKGRLGPYTLPQGAAREFFDRAELRQEEGFLILELFGSILGEAPNTLLLRPDGEERAIVLGLGRGKGAVVRFERQGDAQFLSTKGVRLQLKPAGQSLQAERAASVADPGRVLRALLERRLAERAR
ncbi:hypothetical protein JQX13_03885 [Archangium violaceum]|uniref:hypothetical protein n=1 Tax=Archangium violaceum TaxID=83451 RepID=UPI00193B5174|nr:hypothetical protein [Archangium violaceum]QRK09300.1 hypothetical protein JQX13_03885 [Archangium violaceum]